MDHRLGCHFERIIQPVDNEIEHGSSYHYEGHYAHHRQRAAEYVARHQFQDQIQEQGQGQYLGGGHEPVPPHLERQVEIRCGTPCQIGWRQASVPHKVREIIAVQR